MATVTLLQIKSAFFRYLGHHYASTATSGTAGTLVDTGLIDLGSDQFPFPADGKQVRITSTITDLRRIVKTDKASGTLYPQRAFSSAITTNTYEIWGNSIDGGTQLTNLINDRLRRLRYIDHTQVTIVTDQRHYDITTLVTCAEDVVEVYVRDLDPSSLEPHTPRLVPWFRATDMTSSAIRQVSLEIAPSLTLDTTVNELWVEHYKPLVVTNGSTAGVAFSDDTGTMDATYRDWIAWEAVYEHARMMARQRADLTYWKELRNDAALEVISLRQRFCPTRTRRQLPQRPMAW